VVPNVDQLKAWASATQLPFKDDDTLIASTEAGDKIEREVKLTLRDVAQFEMPKKVLLIQRDFSIETGELTPTLKVKRRVVEKNYQNQIEAMYLEPKGGTHDV
jgi:long-chain acyl-CoA synthetase